MFVSGKPYTGIIRPVLDSNIKTIAFDDGAAHFDARYFPVVLITWFGVISEPGIQIYSEWVDRMASRASEESTRMFLIEDISDCERPTPEVRRLLGRTLTQLAKRHGTLYLSDERLVFVPTILDTILLGRRHEIRLDRLAEVERYPRDVEDLPGGGRRSRLYLHAPECTYELMVPDLDAWIDAIEVVYRLRAKRGETYMPVITRTGVENLLLTDE